MCTSADPAIDENAQPNTPGRLTPNAKATVEAMARSSSGKRSRHALTPLSVDSWVQDGTHAPEYASDEEYEDPPDQEYTMCGPAILGATVSPAVRSTR